MISKYLASVGEPATPAAMPLADEPAPIAASPTPAAAAAAGSAPSPLPSAEPGQAPGAAPVPTGLFQKHSRADEPIGRTSVAIRALAALACLGIAILFVINGQGLVSPWPYVIMVFYASAALWGLTTARQDITLQQFAIEMVVLVVLTLALRAASPDMFAVEPELQTTSATAKPKMPSTPLGKFTARSLDFLRAGDEAMRLEGVVNDARWAPLSKDLDFEDVKRRYTLLDTEDQTSVYDVWKRLENFGPLLAKTIDRGVKPAEGGVQLEIPEAERRAVRAELSDALIRAERLRGRILIYPTQSRSAVKTEYP